MKHLQMYLVGFILACALAITGGAWALPAGTPLAAEGQLSGAAVKVAGAAAVSSATTISAAADLPTDSAMALLTLIVQLVGEKNWLLLIPVLLVLAIFGLRRVGAKWWPWLDTPRGGAVLSICTAAALALWTAIQAPGSVGFAAVAIAFLGFFLTNDLVHKALKTLFWPNGEERAAEADAAGSELEASEKSAAEKVNEAVKS